VGDVLLILDGLDRMGGINMGRSRLREIQFLDLLLRGWIPQINSAWMSSL